MPSGNWVSWPGTTYGLTGPVAMDMGHHPPGQLMCWLSRYCGRHPGSMSDDTEITETARRINAMMDKWTEGSARLPELPRLEPLACAGRSLPGRAVRVPALS